MRDMYRVSRALFKEYLLKLPIQKAEQFLQNLSEYALTNSKCYTQVLVLQWFVQSDTLEIQLLLDHCIAH